MPGCRIAILHVTGAFCSGNTFQATGTIIQEISRKSPRYLYALPRYEHYIVIVE
jgi:hypothetical protein